MHLPSDKTLERICEEDGECEENAGHHHEVVREAERGEDIIKINLHVQLSTYMYLLIA